MAVRIIPAQQVARRNGVETQKKLRVAAYCRVSTDGEDQETSYEAQVTHYTDYISNHEGWELAGVFADEVARLLGDDSFRIRPRKGEYLLLGPFQGKPACIRIPYGKGVCGTCLAEDRVQRVADVHAFPGHIACDSASNSEIVLPLHARDTEAKVIGVLDIDSPVYDRFSAEDEAGLAAIVRILEDKMERDLSWLR